MRSNSSAPQRVLVGAIASLLLLLARPRQASAQITPPGLGNAQTAAWSALGLRQAIDAKERRHYLGYVGIGSASDQHDVNPFAHASIFVFNHELYDHFREAWQYSLAVSYRRQHSYKGDADSWHDEQLQELRFYARFARSWQHAGWKALATFRPELRSFFTPDFARAAEPFQLRLRFKTQLSRALASYGHQRLTCAAELLTSVARERRQGPAWDDFGYRESRFSAFYSFTHDERLIVEVGYMNNLIGNQRPLIDVHYVALDLVWVDLFGRKRG